MSKRIIALILCLSMILVTSPTVYANNENIMGERIVEPFGVWPPTEQEIAAAKYMQKNPNNMMKRNMQITRESGWNNLLGYVVFAQEQNDYCVAASVQAALKYLTGVRVEQSTIFNACYDWFNGITVASAVTDDKSSFMMGDPWIGFSGSNLSEYPDSYVKSIDELYNACSGLGYAY